MVATLADYPPTVDDACTEHIVTSFHTSKAPKKCYNQRLNSLAKMYVMPLVARYSILGFSSFLQRPVVLVKRYI